MPRRPVDPEQVDGLDLQSTQAVLAGLHDLDASASFGREIRDSRTARFTASSVIGTRGTSRPDGANLFGAHHGLDLRRLTRGRPTDDLALFGLGRVLDVDLEQESVELRLG